MSDATDGLFVLETVDGDAYIGRLQFGRHKVTVHNGFVGRPVVIDQADVYRMTPASEHPDVATTSEEHFVCS